MHVFDGAQGIECHFLEAWHQKLHTNTTPEDITVCEAYIAFLESGDIGTYSRVLWENGSISRADMANKWDRKIPGELFQSNCWVLDEIGGVGTDKEQFKMLL